MQQPIDVFAFYFVTMKLANGVNAKQNRAFFRQLWRKHLGNYDFSRGFHSLCSPPNVCGWVSVGNFIMCHLKMAFGAKSAAHVCVHAVHVCLRRSPCRCCSKSEKHFLHCRHINDYTVFRWKIYLSHSHSLTHPFKTRISTKREGKRMLRLCCFLRYPSEPMMPKAEKSDVALRREPRSVEIVDWEKEVVPRSNTQIKFG